MKSFERMMNQKAAMRERIEELEGENKELQAEVGSWKEILETESNLVLDLSAELDRQVAEVERLKGYLKQIEELTPQGSEFYNDPQRCIDFLADRKNSALEKHKKWCVSEAESARLRAEAEGLKAENKELKEKLEYAHDMARRMQE